MFDALHDIFLLTRKFRVLHQIAENPRRFGEMGYLDASLFKLFKFGMKLYMKLPSLRKSSALEVSVQAMNY